MSVIQSEHFTAALYGLLDEAFVQPLAIAAGAARPHAALAERRIARGRNDVARLLGRRDARDQYAGRT